MREGQLSQEVHNLRPQPRWQQRRHVEGRIAQGQMGVEWSGGSKEPRFQRVKQQLLVCLNCDLGFRSQTNKPTPRSVANMEMFGDADPESKGGDLGPTVSRAVHKALVATGGEPSSRDHRVCLRQRLPADVESRGENQGLALSHTTHKALKMLGREPSFARSQCVCQRQRLPVDAYYVTEKSFRPAFRSCAANCDECLRINVDYICQRYDIRHIHMMVCACVLFQLYGPSFRSVSPCHCGLRTRGQTLAFASCCGKGFHWTQNHATMKR